jgi:tryptophan-rich sensory protein
MSIALYLVWKQGTNRKDVKIALYIFGTQLILNVLWSIIFFGLENPGSAFVEIISLWISILLSIIYFYKISKPASYLLIPYITWVSFASYLNFMIWWLN